MAVGGATPPTWARVYAYVATWNADGTVDRVHDRLRAAVRDGDGRDPMARWGSVSDQVRALLLDGLRGGALTIGSKTVLATRPTAIVLDLAR